jgi:hypothetical protein
LILTRPVHHRAPESLQRRHWSPWIYTESCQSVRFVTILICSSQKATVRLQCHCFHFISYQWSVRLYFSVVIFCFSK